MGDLRDAIVKRISVYQHDHDAIDCIGDILGLALARPAGSDALVFASAPDLLEALKPFVKEHAKAFDGIDCQCGYCKTARAAIAKAEGRK